MQGIQRRVVYITLYEVIAITVVSVAMVLITGQSLGHAGTLSMMASAVAVLWNLAFNTVFERWEARQAVRGRSVLRRIAHAIGFEGGLIVFLVPLFAWWLNVSLWQALVLDMGFLVFFLGYTFVFNWTFDAVFGLPASATTPVAAPAASTAHAA
jgi:uncharacterized membrane protein